MIKCVMHSINIFPFIRITPHEKHILAFQMHPLFLPSNHQEPIVSSLSHAISSLYSPYLFHRFNGRERERVRKFATKSRKNFISVWCLECIFLSFIPFPKCRELSLVESISTGLQFKIECGYIEIWIAVSFVKILYNFDFRVI